MCRVNRLLQPPLADDAASDLCEMGSPDPLAAAAARSAWPPDAVPFSSVHVNALFGAADSPSGKRSGGGLTGRAAWAGAPRQRRGSSSAQQ